MWGYRYDLLDFIDNGLTIFVGKVPTGFLIKVFGGIDEIMVGSVADSLKEVTCHKVQTAKIFDAMDIPASLPPPAIEPLSKLLVVFIGSVVLYQYLRSA